MTVVDRVNATYMTLSQYNSLNQTKAECAARLNFWGYFVRLAKEFSYPTRVWAVIEEMHLYSIPCIHLDNCLSIPSPVFVLVWRCNTWFVHVLYDWCTTFHSVIQSDLQIFRLMNRSEVKAFISRILTKILLQRRGRGRGRGGLEPTTRWFGVWTLLPLDQQQKLIWIYWRNGYSQWG